MSLSKFYRDLSDDKKKEIEEFTEIIKQIRVEELKYIVKGEISSNS